MRIGEIDLNLAPLKVDMWLCKPNKTEISKLKDIHGLKYSLKLNKVNEISFSIPAKVERNHQLIANPLIEDIKHRYLIKLVYNNQTEYLVFVSQDKAVDDTESVSYKAYGLGYGLADRDIRGYVAEVKSLTEMSSDILSVTNWKVGYVDSYFDIKLRSHEITTSTILQAIYDIAEKFNAVIVWDTVNLKVNFYNPSNVGLSNRGLRFKEGRYLESLNVTEDSDEMVTRLKLYGQDGLTIRKLTPTGSNYIEDFSWYMYPFKSDGQGNVLQSSDYMSDELCLALESYKKTLATHTGQFESLIEMLLLKQEIILNKKQALSIILTELIVILDELDVYNAAYPNGAGSVEHTAIVNKRNAKQTQIQNAENEFTGLVNEEDAILNQIKDVQTATDITAFLSPALMLELNESYIIEKEYSNDSIVDEHDLLKEGIEAFEKLRAPALSMNFNIVNFLSIVEAQHDWDKLVLGETVLARHERLGIDVKAKIIEINFDYDSDSIDLVIANEADVKSEDDKFLDKIYDAGNTSNIVNMEKFKWGLIEETNSVVSKMLNEAWDTAKRSITAGYEQNITISERGIIIKSPEQPSHWIVIQNGLIAMTLDNGNKWSTAISPEGVVADSLIGRLIFGARLIIEDEDGIIRMSGSKMEIFDSDGNDRVVLGNFENGKYGIKIDSGALEITGGIDATHMNPSLVEQFAYDDAFIRGDLRLTASLPNSISLNASGITAYTSDVSKFARLDYRGLYVQGGAVDIRTSATSNRGVVIDSNGIRGYKTNGTESFNISDSGATFSGSLNAATGTFSGNLSAVSGTFTELSSGTITGATITGSRISTNGAHGITEIYNGNIISAVGGISGWESTWNPGNIQLTKKGFDDSVLSISDFRIQIVQNSGNRYTTYSDNGIQASDYFSQNYQTFTIAANTSFNGSVNFANATVSGLNINSTAKFG